MKNLLFAFALILSMPMFGQIEPKFENRIFIDEDVKHFYSKANCDHFLFLTMMKIPNDSEKVQWKFSYIKDDLNIEWEIKQNIEKEMDFSKAFEVNGNFLFIFEQDRRTTSYVFYKIIKIDAEGIVTSKEIKYKTYANTYTFNINKDALFYFDATSKNRTPIIKLNTLDIKSLDLTSTVIDNNNFPKYYTFENFKYHNKILFVRIKEAHINSGEYDDNDVDKIMMFDKEKVIAEIRLKKTKNTTIQRSHLLETDSTHLFFFGISKKWINGSKSNEQNYDYRLFLSPIKKDETDGTDLTNTLDESYYNQLAEKRTIKGTNAPKLQVDKVSGNGYIINSTFRINNRNYIVFDKYQEMLYALSIYDGESSIYYFTNSVIFCFNDNGEIIWSNSIDYSLYSDGVNNCTFAAPIDNQTIGLTGLFNGKYSTIKISAETGKVSNNENIETNPIFDYDVDYPLSSPIEPLSNNKFFTVGKVQETKEQKKMRRKNNNYNIGIDFKVYIIQ